MPTFAFIAGFVYALRPVTTDHIGSFFLGKIQRLVIPGLIAILLFGLVSSLFHLSARLPLDKFWHPLVYPYAHYWFLQSILALFAIIGLLDAVTKQRAGLPLLLIAIAVYLLPVAAPSVFALNGAQHLAPFFMAGICFCRHRDWILAHARPITVVALALIAAWAVWTAIDFSSDGAIDKEHRKVQAMIFAIPLCTLLIFYLPYNPRARALGQFSFTIYLYHVFATAGTRILLYKLGISALTVHILAGVTAGVAGPILLHLAAMRIPIAAQLLLGVKRRTVRGGPAASPAIA